MSFFEAQTEANDGTETDHRTGHKRKVVLNSHTGLG